MKTGNKFAIGMTALAVAATLAACGGGGGGGITAAPVTPATPAAPVVLAANLVTTVPAPTYTDDPAAAYTLLNIERSTCGFGLLAQSTMLDAAARAHASYLATNLVFSHDETPGLPGFTGANPTDRAKAKGYAGSAGEVAASGTGAIAIRQLLSAPYHLRGLMDGYRDVGIGMQTSTVPEYPYFIADLGVQTAAGGNQLLSSTDVKTYPCDGSAGVNFQLRGETPSPVPDRNLSTNPIGTPIFVKVRDGNLLAITGATMVKVSTGTAITLRAPVIAANDPNKYYRGNEGYVAPDAPLEKGTAYQATIIGTNAGASFSRTINFTTGTGVN